MDNFEQYCLDKAKLIVSINERCEKVHRALKYNNVSAYIDKVMEFFYDQGLPAAVIIIPGLPQQMRSEVEEALRTKTFKIPTQIRVLFPEGELACQYAPKKIDKVSI